MMMENERRRASKKALDDNPCKDSARQWLGVEEQNRITRSERVCRARDVVFSVFSRRATFLSLSVFT